MLTIKQSKMRRVFKELTTSKKKKKRRVATNKMYKNIVTAMYKHRPKHKSFAERGTEVLKGFLRGYEQLETVPKFQNTFI